MKVTREKIEDSQAFLIVEMEPAEMEESMEASYRRLVKKASIPGFRKGKAPRSVLERHMGRESVLEEAINHLVPEAYEKAVKEQQIEPFAPPDIQLTQSEPVIFKAVVPLPPEVKLGDYSGIRLSREPVEITEENVNNVMEELRHQHAVWEPVERPVNAGDMAVINIESTVDEVPFIRKIGVQYQVMKDSISPVPGFAEQLEGMKKDDEKEFKLKVPENYEQSEIAGKEASFKVKVTEIKEEKLPALDDKLAEQISTEFKTLDLLRAEVTKNLKLRAEEAAKSNFEDKLVDAIVEKSQVNYPPVLVEMEINRFLNDRARQLQLAGRSLEDYLKNINKTEAQLREELRPAAVKNVIASLVMNELAGKEKIESTDSDIDAEIERMAGSASEERREDLRKLLDNEQTRDSIRRSLTMKKTLERLGAIAKGPAEVKTEAKEENK